MHSSAPLWVQSCQLLFGAANPGPHHRRAEPTCSEQADRLRGPHRNRTHPVVPDRMISSVLPKHRRHHDDSARGLPILRIILQRRHRTPRSWPGRDSAAAPAVLALMHCHDQHGGPGPVADSAITGSSVAHGAHQCAHIDTTRRPASARATSTGRTVARTHHHKHRVVPPPLPMTVTCRGTGRSGLRAAGTKPMPWGIAVAMFAARRAAG